LPRRLGAGVVVVVVALVEDERQRQVRLRLGGLVARPRAFHRVGRRESSDSLEGLFQTRR
jgi:hypothetical protein